MFRRGAWLLTRRGIVVALAVLATAGIAARGCTRKRAASSAEMFRRVSVSRQELRLTRVEGRDPGAVAAAQRRLELLVARFHHGANVVGSASGKRP